MRHLKFALFSVVLFAATILSYFIISISVQTQGYKQDYAEVNHIQYGLFSVDQWKVQLTAILEGEIGDLNIKGNKKNLKPVIEAQLHSLINNIDQRLQEKNKKTFGGRFKQAMVNTFVDIKDIKEGVPKYADELILVLEKPRNKQKIKTALTDKVDEYFDKTFDEKQDQSSLDAIISRLQVTDVEAAKIKINELIAANQKTIKMLSIALILIAISAFLFAAFNKETLPSSQYIMLLILLLLLLITGVTTPMIDLEAKITEMKFTLLDHSIVFSNQVLYFQTKSVIDVFWLMIRHKDIQMNIVGLLMISFSILFPVTKLISSMAYYYNPRNMRDSKWIQFFVLKSGKWSMTDVMIIAIFMAYIGFNGVIDSQFGELKASTADGMLLTTNGTSLQPGFYLFLAYAVLAMFLTEFLTKQRD